MSCIRFSDASMLSCGCWPGADWAATVETFVIQMQRGICKGGVSQPPHVRALSLMDDCLELLVTAGVGWGGEGPKIRLQNHCVRSKKQTGPLSDEGCVLGHGTSMLDARLHV